MTLNDLVDRYALHRIAVKEQTLDQYRYSVRSLERFHGRTVQVAELSIDLISPWLRYRYRSVKPRTVKRERGDLLVLWRFARARGYCEQGPVDIPSIRVPKANPEAWLLDEFGKLVAATAWLRHGCVNGTGLPRSLYWRSLLLALYDTGARVNAMFLVAPRDVCLSEPLHIVLRPENSKTGLGQVVAISSQTAEAIQKLLEFDASRERVWPGVGRRTRFQTLRRLVKIAGLPEGRQSGFHRIRRTTATMLTKHKDLRAASGVLGHTTEQQTLRYVDQRQILDTSVVAFLPRPECRTA